MIQIYTGNGKGKTTAALGLGLRAIGAGKKVLLAQFLKDGQSSEVKAIRQLVKKNFDYVNFGKKGFIVKNKISPQDLGLAYQGFLFSQKAILSKQYDLIILDEILAANYFKLISTERIVELIMKTPKKIELVLTGRKANRKIIEQADLVTEMKEKKHYYSKGIKARRGIEF